MKFLKAFLYDISKQLSVFVGLIITNCIVMGRAETYAMSNPPLRRSFMDGVANGTGLRFGPDAAWPFVRELLGTGKLFGVAGDPRLRVSTRPDIANNGLMVLAPGAFHRHRPVRLAAAQRAEQIKDGSMENLLGLFALNSVFVGNILLAYFLGMCSFLAMFTQPDQTSVGLGSWRWSSLWPSPLPANWFLVSPFSTGTRRLGLGRRVPDVDLSFLKLVLFIARHRRPGPGGGDGHRPLLARDCTTPWAYTCR